MKNSKKTGISGNENESTTMVGIQESTVNTVIETSTDDNQSDSINVKSIEDSEGTSTFQEEFIERLEELDNYLNTINPECHPYEPNLKDLEYTINQLKRRINCFQLDLIGLYFYSGFKVSNIVGQVYTDFMEKSHDLLDELCSLQDEKKTGINDQIVKNCIVGLNYCEKYSLELLKKKKYSTNEHLKRFLSIVKEYQPVLSDIYEKVLVDNEVDDFISKKLKKVRKIHDKVKDLYNEVQTIRNKRLSIPNKYMYKELYWFLEQTREIPEELDNITLPEEKGFDTNEREFLEIFDRFCDMDFVLDNYNMDELKNGISLE